MGSRLDGGRMVDDLRSRRHQKIAAKSRLWRQGYRRSGSSLPLRGLSTLGQGQGEGSAGDKFRVSGTQETVGGAGASDASGVLEEANPLTAASRRAN